MQAFIDFCIGLIAALAAAALAHLGMDLEPRQSDQREIRRTSDCPEDPSAMISTANRDC